MSAEQRGTVRRLVEAGQRASQRGATVEDSLTAHGLDPKDVLAFTRVKMQDADRECLLEYGVSPDEAFAPIVGMMMLAMGIEIGRNR